MTFVQYPGAWISSSVTGQEGESMSNECSGRTGVNKAVIRNTEGSDSPLLETIVELAEQLDPGQLDRLAHRVDHLRVKGQVHGKALPADETGNLTTRENEVLVLVASGYNRKEIGRTLNISACTAAKHISNIYRKLGVSSVAEATRVALARDVTTLN